MYVYSPHKMYVSSMFAITNNVSCFAFHIICTFISVSTA